MGYGIFLASAALKLPAGAELNGQFWAQPIAKASMAILLAVAASLHPIDRERRWLMGALLLSALGDFLLAIPWWTPAFVCGLSAFLVAHLCYLGALLPLRGNFGRARLAIAAALIIVCLSMVARFWSKLATDGLTVPVPIYISVLAAMVCAALFARMPTAWTAVGAVLFAVVFGLLQLVCRTLGFPFEDRIAVVFCGSKKSIAAGVPMAQVIFSGDPRLGLILLPLLIYHPLQLIICGVLASRWARR